MPAKPTLADNPRVLIPARRSTGPSASGVPAAKALRSVGSPTLHPPAKAVAQRASKRHDGSDCRAQNAQNRIEPGCRACCR
jgi:hypothetical protein